MSSLADLDIPSEGGEKESVPLSEVPDKTKLIIKNTVFKALGRYDGVVFELEEPIKDINNETWSKVHSSSNRIVNKAKHNNFQGALKAGTITATKISGKTDKGTWHDIE